MSVEKKCFVIAPIGEAKSDIRKNSDLLFNHIIKPVMDEFGYDTERADKIGEPGIITSQIIQRIEEYPVVIADLTGPNANVFYELAIRHAIRKPLIQLITKGEQIPFDVSGLRTISFDLTDLDSVEETKKEIKKQFESINRGNFKVETPISNAIDLRRLKESGDPEQKSLAKVTELITLMRSDMRKMRMDIDRMNRRTGTRSGLFSSARDDYDYRMREKEYYPRTMKEIREAAERRIKSSSSDDDEEESS